MSDKATVIGGCLTVMFGIAMYLTFVSVLVYVVIKVAKFAWGG